MLDEHFQPAFDSRTLADVLEPTFRVGVIIQRNFLALPVAHPRIGRDVGNRVIIPGKIAGFAQTRVGHAKQTFRFIRIAVDGILNSVGRVTPEMIGLPHHGTDAAHLPHQPFHRREMTSRIGCGIGQELAGFLGKIIKDRAGLKNRDFLTARTIRIDNGRNAIVWADRQKRRLELRTVPDIHRNDFMLKLTLMQHDVNLVAVGCWPGICADHRCSLCQVRRCSSAYSVYPSKTAIPR